MSDAKQTAYVDLVRRRKQCRACQGLTNPSIISDGAFDSDHIGPWSRWKSDLNARVMVVGQDWGDVTAFRQYAGRDDIDSPTNAMLRRLLASVGIHLSPPGAPPGAPTATEALVFLTNAILCLKEGGCQGLVQRTWFENCARLFLREQIEIINPEVVVALGERAYRAISQAFGLKRIAFRRAVESPPLPLPSGSWLVPVYHCGQRILNTHRRAPKQLDDWARVRKTLDGADNTLATRGRIPDRPNRPTTLRK